MKIIKQIGRNCMLRFWAEDLFKVIDSLPDEDIELDFTGVEFCGRGFTQELLWQAKKSNKRIIYTNRNEEIMHMFYAVEHPRPKHKFECSEPVQIINLDD